MCYECYKSFKEKQIENIARFEDYGCKARIRERQDGREFQGWGHLQTKVHEEDRHGR